MDSIEGKTTKEINKKRERKMAQWLDLPLKFRSPGSAKKSEDVEQEVVIRGEVL